MSENALKPGDLVTITSGPFGGGRGVVQAVDTQKSMVRLQMLVLGEPAPFSVHLNQVKLIHSQFAESEEAARTRHIPTPSSA